MRFFRWLILIVLLMTALTVSAQDTKLSETYTFDSGVSFQYPSDWTLDNKPNYLVDIHSDTTYIYFIDFVGLQKHNITKDSDLNDAAKAYYAAFYAGQRFDALTGQDTEIGGRKAVRYDYDTPDGKTAFMLAIQFSDGTPGVMEAVSSDILFPEKDIVLAVAATFDTGGSTGLRPEATATASSGPACTVSTSHSNSVHVRVGPGSNRTSFIFLPVDQDFDVLGKATDKSGNLWYKLDKDVVAPGKSAAEAWVAAKDVITSGDCDSVVDVNAPPVIPIAVAPPPSTGGSGGSNVSGGTQPNAGNWTINYAVFSPGSCQGGGTVNLQLGFPPESATISGGGSSIIFDGDRYNAIQPGVYQGLFSAPDGSSVLTTLRAASPTSMSIEFILNFNADDGTPCSVTINGTVTHN